MEIENNIAIDINEVVTLALFSIDEPLNLLLNESMMQSISLLGKPDRGYMIEQSQGLPNA